MCEMSYEHRGVEYSDGRANTAAMESLKLAIKKEIRELKLKGNGINLVYAAHTSKGIKEHEIEIQESRGKYTFFLDGKNLHDANSLADCVSWAKNAGHLDKNEKIGETRTAATKPATAATRKTTPATAKAASVITKTTPATAKADDSARRFFGNRLPVSGGLGWR